MPHLNQVFERIAESVEASPLFDESYYARVSGAHGNRSALVRHYLTQGEARLLSPSEEFDVVFYRHTNPDVVRSGMSALVHFIRYGAAEGRYPNRRLLGIDAAKVERAAIFDRRIFAHKHKGALMAGLTEIESYLAYRESPLEATPGFDPAFYADAYDDVPKHHGRALLHYIEKGRRETRAATEPELEQRMRTIERDFVSSHYLKQFPAGEKPRDPLRHYILTGARLGIDPAPDFSVEYYARSYPDLRGRTPLFEHFLVAGRREGRIGRPNLADFIVRGKRPFQIGKRTIVIANHETTRTGAPLVGLMLASTLCERYNVIVGLGSVGDLRPDFLEHSCLGISGSVSELEAEYLLRDLKEMYGIDAVLMNSVETCSYGPAALYNDIPSVALLHEFAEYTVPAGKMSRAVETVDRVVVPADLIRESLQREVIVHRKRPTNNVVVRAQGYLARLPHGEDRNDLTREQIYEALGVDGRRKTKIVLGAGYVQMRKGIDLFVQTAAELRNIEGDDVRLVWVGGGWDPHDLRYSAWVADMLRRLDLEKHVVFFPPQANLDTMLDVADVFYLPSRLDPFPNVVLDAFKAGKAVVCFDRATGIGPHLGEGGAVGAAVPFCDVHAAARALSDMMQDPMRERAPANARFASERFDFDEYVGFLEEQFAVAAASRSELVAAAERMLASGAFDARFYDGELVLDTAQERRRAVLEYAARGSKGLLCFSPRPGFNDGLYRAWQPDRSGPGDVPPLDRALAANDPLPQTHRCIELDAYKPVQPFRGRVALHVHLHYPELALEFMARLAAAECTADLYLTTTSPEKRLEVQYAFRKYKGKVRVVTVPNRGRDIAPLLVGLKKHLRSGGYDVIGHFHGKRSLVVDGSLGDRWRGFLLDTLLGEPENLLQVLSLFEDRNVGLVFAEDRHCIGWTENRPPAEKLAGELLPRPTLPEFPVFPLGTMFWARTATLEPLWRRDFEITDFPAEPTPYDGSVLHALERMMPAICESTGRTWCTVHHPVAWW